MTAAKTLRTLLAGNRALIAPAVFNPLSAKLAEGAGFEVLYLGGGTVGYLNCCLEANLNITQLCQAGIDIRAVCNLPLILDGAAGFGDPMHMHHTIGMAEAAGFAAIEIEDQILPKRAHHHVGIEHMVPLELMAAKVSEAVKARRDPDFVIIARSDACREQGYKEAVKRMRVAKDVGADMGLIFPRSHKETVNAPKDCKLPLVYVQSRGNRDQRPLYSNPQLKDMGYAGCIDAILAIGVHFHHMRKALLEIRKTGDYTGMTKEEWITARHDIETLIGLDDHYKIERETVEKVYYAKKKRS